MLFLVTSPFGQQLIRVCTNFSVMFISYPIISMGIW